MPRPIAARRHQEIIARVDVERAVSVEELAALFDVSRETIRRDLKMLAGIGRLELVHGGALRREGGEPSFAERRAENAAGKAAIAGLAVDLVSDNTVVMLDSGSTTYAIAVALARSERRNLTICTTSLAHAQVLIRAGARVYLLGGELDPNDEATIGVDAIEAAKRFRVDLAFVGIGGISPEGDVTDFSRVAVEQRAAMLAAAQASYLVADHRKFGRTAPVRLAIARRPTTILSDRPPPPVLKRSLKAAGLIVVHPGPKARRRAA